MGLAFCLGLKRRKSPYPQKRTNRISIFAHKNPAESRMLSNKKSYEEDSITSKVFEREQGRKLSEESFLPSFLLLSKTTKGRLKSRRPFHIPTCGQEESVNHSAMLGQMNRLSSFSRSFRLAVNSRIAMGAQSP